MDGYTGGGAKLMFRSTSERGHYLNCKFGCFLVAMLILTVLPGIAHGGNVNPAPAKDARPVLPQTRIYYIAADEVEWDYAPSGTNLIEDRPFNEDEKAFMEPGPTVIGRKLKKAVYQE